MRQLGQHLQVFLCYRISISLCDSWKNSSFLWFASLVVRTKKCILTVFVETRRGWEKPLRSNKRSFTIFVLGKVRERNQWKKVKKEVKMRKKVREKERDKKEVQKNMLELEGTRVTCSQFHQTLWMRILCTKVLLTAFCAYILGLYFFGHKNSAQKLLLKCWWNWHLDRERGVVNSEEAVLNIFSFSTLHQKMSQGTRLQRGSWEKNVFRWNISFSTFHFLIIGFLFLFFATNLKLLISVLTFCILLISGLDFSKSRNQFYQIFFLRKTDIFSIFCY